MLFMEYEVICCVIKCRVHHVRNVLSYIISTDNTIHLELATGFNSIMMVIIALHI